MIKAGSNKVSIGKWQILINILLIHTEMEHIAPILFLNVSVVIQMIIGLVY